MVLGTMIIAGLSFLLSLVLVAVVLRLSHNNSWYDQIDERKVHTGDVPRLGGLGFSLAFIVVAAALGFIAPFREGYGFRFLPVIAAMFMVLCLGVVDDFRPLTPRKKLVVQIAAALLVVLPGYTFRRLFFFDLGSFGVMEWWLRYPLTMLWLVGMTNAVNFIDGVDGLSGGISLLIALAYGIIFPVFSAVNTLSILCFSLAAAVGGFLVFNLPLPRARIFMGDGGALFLGFVLAVLPLIDQGTAEGSVLPLPLPYAAALLLIPILDVTAAVWRRVRDHRPIDSPDRSHVHHKLMSLGLGAAGLDALLWGLQILLNLLVCIAVLTPGPRSLPILGAAYALGIGFFSTVHFLHRRSNSKKPQGAGTPGSGA